MEKKYTAICTERRQELVAAIKREYPQVTQGVVVLVSNFEGGSTRFRQESSMYYFTGVTEPASIAVVDLDGGATLYIPWFAQRSQWISGALQADAQTAQRIGFSACEYLGEEISGYSVSPLFSEAAYKKIITRLAAVIAAGGTIFTCLPKSPFAYVVQQQVMGRLSLFLPDLIKNIQDISFIIGRMRRKKTKQEIERMYQAIDLTMVAHQAAMHVIDDGVAEAAVQAGINYVFIEGGASEAFPSIIGSGSNSTVLHYHDNNQTMKNGDLVVVDIGAELNHYCADITRTYPVSGAFTQRQREVYNMVLATQDFIASRAKPGMWLSNKAYPDKSLQHLAVSFLEKKGYDKYFTHNIGHFLGLDVHDVGDVLEPLEEGDVITIEPGIYIPQERLGVRIEDNYWIIKDGVQCLSEPLVKAAHEVEELMHAEFEDEDDMDEDEH